MSAIRSALFRSMPLVSRRTTQTSLRAFSRPTAISADEKDEGASRAGYEKHRVGVEPKLAGMDENIKFTTPKTWKQSDPGHDVTGAGHGRHNKRTLASLSMEGKICVITGAGRGLGNMVARTFVESGADSVALIDLKQEDADSAAKDLTDWFVKHGEAQPGEIHAVGYGCDVADETSVKDTFAKIEKDFGGRIDVTAGIVENLTAHEYPTAKVKKLLDINVMGTWFCALEAAKRMPEGGSIIMFGSMSGQIVNVPQPQTPYNFSKAAVRHMGRSLAVEWAKQGIRVNVISPGYTLTALSKAVLDTNPILRDEWLHRIPMGRMADPSDLKGTIVLLASDASKYITGAEMVVDGGYTAC